MNTETLEHRWNAYMTAFGAIAAEERERLLEASVCDDVVFTNPGGAGKSRAGLLAHIQTFQTANPGAYFSTEKLFAQADTFLAIWSMYKQDGTQVATGYNFVRPGQDGRFSYMAGFF
jgi:hypothetical protein